MAGNSWTTFGRKLTVGAVLIAALVSTVDSGLNSFSTVFTLDIYVSKYRPDATPAEIKWVGRLAMIGVARGGRGCT